ncbi:MAG: TetR/AcrR family transcriptional regulator [Rhizobiales bacterium]|nr:TetR/AcrR family transcriptional regulator [Hyphomicrobiales bacterium]
MARRPRTAKTLDDVINAALDLALTRSWRDIRLNDIAGEAGMTLAELREFVPSKIGILKALAARSDRDLLASLEKDPVEGDVHDRLFDIVMRRLELLEPHKAAFRNIISDPADGAADWATLGGALIDGQGWTLAAAGIEEAGRREGIKRQGLAMVTARTMKVWAEDDDPGLAKTMASLDRSLRDGAKWLERLDAPLAMGQAFANLALAMLRRRSQPASDETEKPAE